MPIAKVQLEDGRIARFEVPEGTTPEQVTAYAENTFPAKQGGYYEKFLNMMQGPTGMGPMGLNPNLMGARLLGEGFNQANKNIGEGAYAAGGAVTDITGSPAAGYATNIGLQAIPAIAQGQIAKQVFAPAMQGGAESLMRSALKPTIKQIETGEADTAIKTLLKEGLNPTKGGVEQLRSMSKTTSNQLAEALKKSTATVNVDDVGNPVEEVLKRVRTQANPLSDIQAVEGAWDEFKHLHPLVRGRQDIPVQLAQALKQGTYKELTGKYGELGSAATEAQKGIARGLKKGISQAVPEASALNARNSALLQTLDVAERRALMDLNKNPFGLSLLAENKGAFAAFVADKSALFKSLLARMMNAGSSTVPNVAGAGATLANQAYIEHLREE